MFKGRTQSNVCFRSCTRVAIYVEVFRLPERWRSTGV